jgi:hypothetical protein
VAVEWSKFLLGVDLWRALDNSAPTLPDVAIQDKAGW